MVCNICIHSDSTVHTQGRVQPDQGYLTVQITDINFECSHSMYCTSITHYMMGNMTKITMH